MSKIKDTIKSIFGKAQEDALKAVATADAAAKETGDEDTYGDEMPGWAKDMKECMDAMNATISSMATPTTAAKDEEKEAAEKAAKEKEAKDADPMQAVMDAIDSIGKRLDALEGKATGDDEETEEKEETGDDEGEEMLDEDADEGEETGDEGKMEVLSGDTASRIEILAPGLELEAKDPKAKAKALKHCYATKDGKKIIGALSGGKQPKWTDGRAIDSLFVSASEVLKAKRVRDNSKTKFADKVLIDGTPDSKVMTAEKMNEMNSKFYAKRAEH